METLRAHTIWMEVLRTYMQERGYSGHRDGGAKDPHAWKGGAKCTQIHTQDGGVQGPHVGKELLRAYIQGRRC